MGLFTANGIDEDTGGRGNRPSWRLRKANSRRAAASISGFSSLEKAVGKQGEHRPRRGSRNQQSPSDQFSELADDADDEWNDEPDFEIGDLSSNLLPVSPHKLSARHRLERLLERRRLETDLRDLLDDDDDEDAARRRRGRRQRAKRKPIADA